MDLLSGRWGEWCSLRLGESLGPCLQLGDRFSFPDDVSLVGDLPGFLSTSRSFSDSGNMALRSLERERLSLDRLLRSPDLACVDFCSPGGAVEGEGGLLTALLMSWASGDWECWLTFSAEILLSLDWSVPLEFLS